MCVLDWKILLDYLRVFLSWPPVVGVLVVCSLRLFHKEFGELIERIRDVKTPIGSLTMQQPADSQVPLPPPDAPQVEGEAQLIPEPEPAPGAGAGAAEVEIQIDALQATIQHLEGRVSAVEAQALYWQYTYLNYFLIQPTQDILQWLSNLGRPAT